MSQGQQLFTVQKWPAQTQCREAIAEEVAIALVYNGLSHVVMMASPMGLEDFAMGFSLSEGIIQSPQDILGIEAQPRQQQGIELHIELNQACFALLKQHRRNLSGRTGCGLCGAESLKQAIRPIAGLNYHFTPPASSIDKAVKELEQHQKLQQMTGAVHGAGLYNQAGELLLLREDIGRHNALDKLLGAATTIDFEPANSFVLVSSRGSYEMVQKSARCGIPCLVCVSAVTSLAIEQAQNCGQHLIGFARPGRHTHYTSPNHG